MYTLEQIQMVYYTTGTIVALVLTIVVMRKAGYFRYRRRFSRLDNLEAENERRREQISNLREDIGMLDRHVGKLRKQIRSSKKHPHFIPRKKMGQDL